MLPVRNHFPIEAEVERLCPGSDLAVPSSVVGELETLVRKGVPGARAAVALARTLPTLRVPGRGDSAILRAALEQRAWVVTADRALASRLRSQGITVLVPRDRHRLEIHRGRTGVARDPRSGCRG